MYYKICDFCGANLDPGEKCDCRKERDIKVKKLMNLFEHETDGQIRIKMEVMSDERINAAI